MQSIDELHASIPHANCLYLDGFLSWTGTTAIPVGPSWGGMDELRPAVEKAHQLGLKVTIRIRIRGVQGISLNQLTFIPSDVPTFFSAWTEGMKQWAAWCQSLNVEQLAVGAELELLEVNAYSAYWTTVINAVRSLYAGTVWYTTNWGNSLEAWTRKNAAAWMNMLDMICVSNYPGLVLAADIPAFPATVTVEQLMQGYLSFPSWGGGTSSFKGQNLVSHYENFSLAHNKKLMFHMNLASLHGISSHPWDSPGGTPVDVQEQANWLQAFFNIFGSKTWIDGWLLDGAWFTVPLIEKAVTSDTSLQNKPAAQVVEASFAALSPGVTDAGSKIVAAVVIGTTVLGLLALVTRKR